MNFEHRVTLSAALAVAVAVLLAALASYLIVRQELHQTVASSLTISLRTDEDRVTGRFARAFPAPSGARTPRAPTKQLTRAQRLKLLLGPRLNRIGEPGIVELVSADGKLTPAYGIGGAQEVRASSALERLARSRRGTLNFTARIEGTDYEVLAGAIVPGVAIVIDRSLSEQDATLAHLRVVLLVVAAIGIALAALLGWFVGRTTVAPVRRLTAAAEHVAATNDLAARIDETRRDELGSLARSFNAMLHALDGTMRALDESARSQRQLVADASHELRTPVTSLRTNIEFLQQSEELEPEARRRLISDVVTQLDSDLIELARNDEEITEPLEDVRLDVLVSESIEWARLHSPQARFDVTLEETVVSAVPSRLGRAVNNLLDNAVKFAGTDAPIEVRLSDGELAIRDHGPGIDPAELPHIFDRFFRGARSRSLPGSGLGLAIVRQVVERHAGSVTAAAAPGGGTIVRLRMPVVT
jgi:two-component system sensor histidine kinase MprB